MNLDLAPTVELATRDGQPVIDSRELARLCGIECRSTHKLIHRYRQELEGFGRVGFEILPFDTAGGKQGITFALLTEDQATFLITLSRNTAAVVRFKAALVKAFRHARERLSAALPAPEDIAARYMRLFDQLVSKGVTPDRACVACGKVFSNEGQPTEQPAIRQAGGRPRLYLGDEKHILRALADEGPLPYRQLQRAAGIPDPDRFKNSMNRLRMAGFIITDDQGRWIASPESRSLAPSESWESVAAFLRRHQFHTLMNYGRLRRLADQRCRERGITPQTRTVNKRAVPVFPTKILSELTLHLNPKEIHP